MADYAATGIDISEFNGNVDIAGLKGQVDFVIIRCGYGSDYANQDDTEYEANVQKCEAAGIPYGVYLYSYAKNTDMARSEAAHTLRLLKGKRPLYGVWYDVEDSSLPAGEAIVDNCVVYCDAIEKAGYYCGIYSFLYWMENRLSDPRLDRFDKWVAQWNDTLEYEGSAGMWQYTNNGLLNGKRFDMDRAFRDYPKIIEEMEGTDMTREEVAALARQEAQKVYNQNETKYRTISAVPNWAREAVEQVYDELQLAGTGSTADGETRINASSTYVRALYVISRILDRMDGRAFSPAAEEQTPDGETPEGEPEETEAPAAEEAERPAEE